MGSSIPPAGGRKHIVLVVEDEPGLRFLVTEMLDQDGGFRIIEAKSADEAYQLLEQNLDVDCVFTDIRMPGRYDGVDLTRHILKEYPAIKVVMTSGHFYAGSPVDNVPLLPKPYDLSGLPDRLRLVISAPH